MTRRNLAAAVAAALTFAACGGGGPSRADAVGELTATAVADRFEGVADLAAALPGVVADWCAGGSGDDTVAAVATAREAWAAQAPFWSGPVMERRSRFVIDPAVTPEAVDELAAGTHPVDADSLRELAGADQRGLGAIEGLVQRAPTERACAYAAAAADLVASEAAAVADDWRTYGPALAADDEVANIALRDMISDALAAIRIVKDDPEAAGNAGRVAGARWLLLGDATTAGLAPLLSDSTVERLRTEFDEGAVNEYERTIATNVVGELGITVNFSDADGDG